MPVDLILADALPRSDAIMRLGVGAEFAAIKVTGAALPGSFGVDRAMTIATLHVDSSGPLTPNGLAGSRNGAAQRPVPGQATAARLLSARKMSTPMQNVVNRRWLLASYPKGMPSTENWTMDAQPVPDPGPGQILVKAKWLSVDPYMRGRMNPGANYTKGVGLGEVMQGGGVGEVVVSNHPAWKSGDIAESMSFGWQEWSVLTPDVFGPAGVNKIDPKLAPIESSLSWLGMPGVTAYFGLLEVGRPRPGETVVVSAASGAVGQLVGQIAKLAGCRAIAIAGDDDKLQWCRDIGFDAAINYKKAADLAAAVKDACPQGVDVFFDNTAGSIHDAVMKNLSIGARVVICGRVALAGRFGEPDIGERFMGHLIVTRASIHGFLVFDWWHRRNEALKRLAAWQEAGNIRYKEDVLGGIERMPEAFLRLLQGKNFGKQIVKIG
jgi:NADPH-dependent curcumin reductase CurA